MRFHDEGKWHSIVVDDYIPCRVSGTTHIPSCARCRDPNECWVMLLEKVWFLFCFPAYFLFFSPQYNRGPLCLFSPSPCTVAMLSGCCTREQYAAALLPPAFLQREVLLCLVGLLYYSGCCTASGSIQSSDSANLNTFGVPCNSC